MDKRNEDAKMNRSYLDEKCTYKPKIDSVSKKIIDRKSPKRSTIEELYKDAQRRQVDKSIDHDVDRTKNAQLLGKKQSDRLLSEKIDKEIQIGCIQLELSDNFETMTQTQLFDFLQMFGYVNKNDQETTNKAWVQGRGDMNKGLTKHNLKVLLHGIHNLWCPSWMQTK